MGADLRPGGQLAPTGAVVVLCGAPLLAACSEPVKLGSEILWQAGHESADLGEWERSNLGGVVDGIGEVGDELARTGRFSARLVNPADRLDVGPCLWRQFADLPRAFYSAWYFLPKAPTTRSGWTLLRFRTQVPDENTGEGGAPNVSAGEEGGAGGEGAATEGPAGEWRSVIDLGMRSLPDGTLALYVFDHDRAHLRLPLAVPPAVLPVGRWFHLEAFYESSPDPAGKLVVWLDGQPVYSIADRPLGDGANVLFAVCNAGESTEDEAAELFVDDVVVSRIRTTPAGRLR